MAPLNSHPFNAHDESAGNSNASSTNSTTTLDLNRLSQLISDPSALASLLQSNLPLQTGQMSEDELNDKEHNTSSGDSLTTNFTNSISSTSSHNFLEPILQRLAGIDCSLPYAGLMLPSQSIALSVHQENETALDRLDTPDSVEDQRISASPPVDAPLTANVHSCQLCEFTSPDKIQYNAHVDAHFDNRCTICNYGTRTKGRLNRHIREFHKELAEQLNLNGVGRRRSTNNGNSSPSTSRKRKKSTDSMEGEESAKTSPLEKRLCANELIAKHQNGDEFDNQSQQSNASDAIPSTGNGGAESGPGPAAESRNNGRTNRTIAGETFANSVSNPGTLGADEPIASTSTGRARNSRQVAKRARLKCHKCGHVSESKEDQWAHNKSHMKKEKMLECTIPTCSFSTELKHHLEYHLRKHFNSKPFKCIKCGYLCTNKSMLTSHLKSHSPIYPYRCCDCLYTSKYCHSLKTHLRKFKHQPDKVLNLDGTENPNPIIDVWGTRRGPRPKKGSGSLRLVRQMLQASSNGTETETPEMAEAILASESLEGDEEKLMEFLRNKDEKEDKVDEELKQIIDQQISEKAAAAAAAATVSNSPTDDEIVHEGKQIESKPTPKNKPKSNFNGSNLKSLNGNRKSPVNNSEQTSSDSIKNNTKVHNFVFNHSVDDRSRNQPLNLSSPSSCNVSCTATSAPNSTGLTNGISTSMSTSTANASTTISMPFEPSSSSSTLPFSSSVLTNASFAQLLQQTLWSQLAMHFIQPQLQTQQPNQHSTSSLNATIPAQQNSTLLHTLATHPFASNLVNSFPAVSMISNQSTKPVTSTSSFSSNDVQSQTNGSTLIQQQLSLQQLLRSNNRLNNAGLISPPISGLGNNSDNLSPISLLGLNSMVRSNPDPFSFHSHATLSFNSAAVQPSSSDSNMSTCLLNRSETQTPIENNATATVPSTPSQSDLNNLLGYSMLLLKMQQMNGESRDRLTSSSSRTSSETNSID